LNFETINNDCFVGVDDLILYPLQKIINVSPRNELLLYYELYDL